VADNKSAQFKIGDGTMSDVYAGIRNRRRNGWNSRVGNSPPGFPDGRDEVHDSRVGELGEGREGILSLFNGDSGFLPQPSPLPAFLISSPFYSTAL
jgi:hypothetical protein